MSYLGLLHVARNHAPWRGMHACDTGHWDVSPRHCTHKPHTPPSAPRKFISKSNNTKQCVAKHKTGTLAIMGRHTTFVQQHKAVLHTEHRTKVCHLPIIPLAKILVPVKPSEYSVAMRLICAPQPMIALSSARWWVRPPANTAILPGSLSVSVPNEVDSISPDLIVPKLFA